ncbi:nicotinate (nicotinamide) nucleotide adenylyltransferase [Alloprevotella rava]|uniref:Probable nicotinate-nucleotide adenylyltransferase n=2 Tax=Alloprevotella rava TaxID=671218 RepID=G5G960_9BACT|nr:nicotinate (nicotinamide) nucleotide adenylyltransferase [Alloprevotella rava]EHG24636.1 nicotinate nucleotide adenylyltransferase [Alloprevotella rava F0323]MBB3703208.1 nicotinate-nucleotide adenylyltransferase [Alloprevotella rava]
MKRLCIFGGSFNPIHLGHIGIARAVVEQHLSDEVLLMVSPQNPWKEDTDLAPEADRLRWACEAVREERHIKASNFEFSLPRPSFTWRTLEALRKAYPHCRLQLLIGGDNWVSFDHWAHYEEILATTDIIVYPRRGSSVEPLKGHEKATIHVVNAPLFSWSSTQIRAAIRRGENVREMVPAPIIEDVVDTYMKALRNE